MSKRGRLSVFFNCLSSAIFIYTKEYRKRPKEIPSSKEMERKNGKLEGIRKMYFQNGNISVERNYTNSISDGLEKEYYEDGTLKQKGVFINGKEDNLGNLFSKWTN